MTRADGGVALKVHAPFLMEDVDTSLLEVGVDLDLVDCRLDASASNKISQLRDHAIADTDRLCQASVNESLHASPSDMVRR